MARAGLAIILALQVATVEAPKARPLTMNHLPTTEETR